MIAITMAQPNGDSGAGALLPVSVAQALPPPPPSMALREFSEALFDAQDKIPEGLYLKINEAAVKLHRECTQRADVRPTNYVDVVRVRDELDAYVDRLEELRSERNDLQEQLTMATVQIEKLVGQVGFYAKIGCALKDIVVSCKVPDDDLLTSYEGYGIKEDVLELRRRRKRKRGDPEVAPEYSTQLCSDDSSDEEF